MRSADREVGGIESVWGKRDGARLQFFVTEREEIRNLDHRGQGRVKDRHER